MRSLSTGEGLAALERVLARNPPQVAVCPLDVRQWVEFFPSAAASPLLGSLMVEEHETLRPSGDRGVLHRLAAAEPQARARLLEEVLRSEVGKVLRIATDKIGREVPLAKLGMDSLMGLELRNRIEVLLGIRLPAGALWTFPTLAALAVRSEPTAVAAPAPSTESLVKEVADMAQGDLMSFVDTLLERANPSSK